MTTIFGNIFSFFLVVCCEKRSFPCHQSIQKSISQCRFAVSMKMKSTIAWMAMANGWQIALKQLKQSFGWTGTCCSLPNRSPRRLRATFPLSAACNIAPAFVRLMAPLKSVCASTSFHRQMLLQHRKTTPFHPKQTGQSCGSGPIVYTLRSYVAWKLRIE